MEIKIPLKRNRNLIPYPFAKTSEKQIGYDRSQCINGLTFTDNGDGSVTINGTASGHTQFYLTDEVPIDLIKGKTYTLSGCPENNNQYVLECELKTHFDGGDSIVCINTCEDKGITFTERTDEENLYAIRISVRTGAVLDNVKIEPQLEIGEKTDFEPVKWKVIKL